MTDHVHTHGPGGCGHHLELPTMPLPPELPPEHDDDPIVDLAAALRASIDRARTRRGDNT